MIRNLTPHVSAIATESIAPLRGKGEFDFVRDFSAAFPVSVNAEMLGIEPERRADFKRWTDDIISASNRATATEEERQCIRHSVNEARAYFETTIAHRRQALGDDIISAFARAEEEKQALTAAEVLSLSILLLLAARVCATSPPETREGSSSLFTKNSAPAGVRTAPPARRSSPPAARCHPARSWDRAGSSQLSPDARRRHGTVSPGLPAPARRCRERR